MTSEAPSPSIEVLSRRVAPGSAPSSDFTYSVVETGLLLRKGERRNDQRARTRLREGLVAEKPGRVIVDCRIRDRSKRGARLQLDKDRPLPKSFVLTEAGTRQRFWATLVWQTGRDAGVRLVPLD